MPAQLGKWTKSKVGEHVKAHEPLLFLHARIEQSLRPILRF
jgi:thymidine phosphorylase